MRARREGILRSTMLLQRSAIALACAVMSLPAAAHAQGVTSTLSWSRLSGAEACPTVVQVAEGVQAMLGRQVLVEASTADRIVEASVAPSSEAGETFAADIRVSTPAGELLGERRLASHQPDCADLLEIASMAIALMIDPDAIAEPEPAPAPAPAPVPVPTPAPAPAIRFTLDLGGAATLGVGPFVSGAGYLRAILTLPGFVPFGIVGLAQPFSRAESASGAVDFSQVMGGVTICPLFFHGARFSAGVCAGVDIGGAVVVGNARGEALRESERLLVQLDVQAYGRIALIGPLSIQLLAALFVPFRNEPWALMSGTAFYAPEPVAGMLGLGIAIDLALAGDAAVEQHLP